MTGRADFERLVDQHYAALYRFALSLSGQDAEACDLTQQAFYIWAQKGYQLQNPSKAKSWLFTTLRREFLLGKRRLTRFPQQPLTEADLPPSDPRVVDRVDGLTVVEKLSRLDPLFRAPVALFYLEDYSYKEIASILEIPLGTVKSRIARGLAYLQGMLQRDPASRPATKETP